MSTSTSTAEKLSPYLLSLLRITVGIVFIRHGMQLVYRSQTRCISSAPE